MKWYLIVKGDEYHLGRFTATRRRNEERHGWRVIAHWPLIPTNTVIFETMLIDKWAQEEAAS